MKKSLSELIFADMIFIFLLAVSSVVTGALSVVVWGAAFIIPALLLASLWRIPDDERVFSQITVSINKRSITYFLFLAAPTVLLVILLSFLTSAVLTALGAEPSVTDLGDSLFYAILKFGVAPAIFEEMLFRYMPLRALGGYSPRLAVIYSAALFALAHCNLFQLPYALLAGAAFALVDIAAKSILPSMLIHLINNLLSVGAHFSGSAVFYPWLLAVLGALTLLSFVYIIVKRKSFASPFVEIFKDKSKLVFTLPLYLYIFVSLLIAVLLLA